LDVLGWTYSIRYVALGGFRKLLEGPLGGSGEALGGSGEALGGLVEAPGRLEEALELIKTCERLAFL
jgi:hypothetical protein